MALEIKPPPVLEGKAAREFYERWANAKCSKSKEDVQKIVHKWSAYWAEQDRLHPETSW